MTLSSVLILTVGHDSTPKCVYMLCMTLSSVLIQLVMTALLGVCVCVCMCVRACMCVSISGMSTSGATRACKLCLCHGKLAKGTLAANWYEVAKIST